MRWRIVLLGVVAFAAALLAVLPVRWAARFLPPDIQCTSWSGSMWQAQCHGLRVNTGSGTPLLLDSVRWKIHSMALLRLTLDADVSITSTQGDAQGRIELRSGNRIALHAVSGHALLDRRLAAVLPARWNGRLEAQQLELQVQGRTLQKLSGGLAVHDFNDGNGGALGSYTLQFPAAKAPPFIGTLKDAGGPLEVSALLTVTGDRSWVLDGLVAARSAAPGLNRQLDMLGPPDANGKRHLSAAGSFD